MPSCHCQVELRHGAVGPVAGLTVAGSVGGLSSRLCPPSPPTSTTIKLGSTSEELCRICQCSPETGLHLLAECEEAIRIADGWAADNGIVLPPARCERMNFVLGNSPPQTAKHMCGIVYALFNRCTRKLTAAGTRKLLVCAKS